MGKRGPQPENSEIKRLKGNPGKRPIKAGVKASGAPECPGHLDEYARAVWDRLISSMPPRLYSGADRELLAAYCIAAETHQKAYEELKTEGHVVTGDSGAPYQNPWESIKNKQAQLMASLGARLGLDPAARESLSAPSDPAAPKSKFEGLVAFPGGKAKHS